MPGWALDVRSSGARVIVPDDPWSTIYDPARLREPVAAIVEGLGDRVAWKRYVDHKSPWDESVRALALASTVWGARLKIPRKGRR